MSILWVHEALTSGTGVAEHDAGNSYVRVFDVLTDSYDDNAATVANATDPSSGLSIPAPYSYFSKGNDSDYGSIVTRIVPDRDARYPYLWHVRVEYTVLRANTSDGQWPGGTLNITYALPTVRIWPIAVTEILDKDVNGNRIANKAGQPFKPRPEDVRYIKAVEIGWYIRTYTFSQWEPYEDSTNAAAVWGCPVGTVLMIGPPSATRKVDNIGTYYEIRAEFHYDKRGWKRSFLNAGKFRVAADNGDPPSASTPATGVVPITDNFGMPVDEDRPLDNDGQPLAQGAASIWLDYTVKQAADWGPMNLPALNITF